MNQKRRDILRRAREMLRAAHGLVETVEDQELDAMQNLPENLQGSERYDKMEDAVSNIQDAESHIESALDKLAEAAAR